MTRTNIIVAIATLTMLTACGGGDDDDSSSSSSNDQCAQHVRGTQHYAIHEAGLNIGNDDEVCQMAVDSLNDDAHRVDWDVSEQSHGMLEQCDMGELTMGHDGCSFTETGTCNGFDVVLGCDVHKDESAKCLYMLSGDGGPSCSFDLTIK